MVGFVTCSALVACILLLPYAKARGAVPPQHTRHANSVVALSSGTVPFAMPQNVPGEATQGPNAAVRNGSASSHTHMRLSDQTLLQRIWLLGLAGVLKVWLVGCMGIVPGK